MYEMLGDISKTKKPVYKQGGYTYDGGGEVVIDNVTYILYGSNWINKNTGAVVKDEYLKYRLYNAKPNESVAQNPIKPVTIATKTRKEKIKELKNSPLLDNQKEVEILREAQRKKDLYNPQINIEDMRRPEDGSYFVGTEYDLNKSLGFPMDKAVIAADAANQNSGVPDGVVANDQADNFRHPNAARYTAEAIANNTGNIPYLSNALGFLGANALGIGHELSSHLITQFNPKMDERPLMLRLQESGEDIYNNYVGAKVGASSMTPEEKTNYLLYLSNTNRLPDGMVYSINPEKGFSNNMYFKKDENDKGQYKSSYAKGGSLLTKKVTCKSCGWKWDAADGGNDVTTCHKCGGQGLIHAQEGGALDTFAKGGEPCPDGFEYINGNCVKKSSLENCEDGRCEETDQIQKILDEGSYIPKKNVNIMWDVVDANEGYKTDYAGDFNRDPKNARNIWTSKGAQALSKRLGMYGPDITNVGNCMWSAGMGYQCLPETKGKIPLMPFESNDKFINAVNKGTVPFSRVAETHDPNFAFQETGMLRQGDIINFKGAGNSHAMTFSNYDDDGNPIFLDSNGQESNFGWNRGMWPKIIPNKEKVAYVSRFNPEKFYEKDIKVLEEKARTNPTMIEKEYGGLHKFVNGGNPCPMFYKPDPISGECIPFTETEKSEYGLQYMKDWVQSPMHNEMLKSSVEKDISKVDKGRVLDDEEKVLLNKYVNKYSKNITDLRLKATNPKVSIEENDNDNLPLGEAFPYQLKDPIYFDDPSTLKFMNYKFADYDNQKNIDKNLQAEVFYYTENYPGEHAYVYPHEFSHLQDMGGSLIPQSDTAMMQDYAFTPEIQAAYQNMRKELKDISDKYPFDPNVKIHFDTEQATKLLDEQDVIYKKYYPQFHKRYHQDKELYEKDFNKYKVQNVPKELTDIWKTLDNTLPYDEFIKKYKRFGDPVKKHSYLSNFSETRARLNAIRMYGKASGIYNPFEEKLSPEKYKELQNLFYNQNPNASDANQLRQLREVYTDEEIFNLLNTISKNESQQIDEIKTPQAKHGGLFKFVGGGPTDCDPGYYWNGTKCVPTYGINPSLTNNALTNNVNGINTKIAETKRKGMAYQSTADKLNALNIQKEKLKAEEAKRKALEAQERQRIQQLRTVGSDNTRVDNSIIKNKSISTVQAPYEQALTITKAQKDAAREIVNSGDFAKHFPDKLDYYLSKENSYNEAGPLTMEELALQEIRTNPNFFQTLEERKYQDFVKREQKMYDEMPWYMKDINNVNAFASDPITTLERGLLEFKRPLAFQGLQSTDPSIVGNDARFYDRLLNRNENVLNNTLNYINPFRAASSAGQNLQQGDYGDAIVDFATIIPMLKGVKAGWKGLTKGLTNAGKSSLGQATKAAWRAPLPLGETITNATAGALTTGAAVGLGFGIHGALNEPENLNRFIANPNLDTGVDLGISTLEMLTSPGVGNAMKFGVKSAVKGAKDLAKFFSIDSKAASITDDIALDLESQIAKLKQQQVYTDEFIKVLASDYKAGKISAKEYTSLYKELDPNKLLNSKVELETILREHKIKQSIVNTPQQNILNSEKQLGKNISDGGINNKGVFEVGDKYVAKLSAHGYDDASILVNYADKIKSPRIAKTLQVKELNGNVYQVQEKVTGTPLATLTETELQNIPKKHIDNFLKDKAELEELGLYIDFDNVNSNILYDSKKGFQFIDLGISPVGKNMMESNELFAQTYKGLNLPGSRSSFSPTSINAVDTGSPLNRFVEKKYLSKAEAEALKLANPQMETKLIKEAKIKGTILPERFPLTIEGQEQAFDEATDFGLNWGLKDADAYKVVQNDFKNNLQRYDEIVNDLEKYRTSTKFKEIDQKVSNIYKNILEEYLQSKNMTIDDYLKNGDHAEYELFFNNKRAEIIAENSGKSIDLQRGESYRRKINNLESEKQQLFANRQLIQDSKESLIDPTFKEKVINLYREVGVPEMQIPKNAFYDKQGNPITNFGKDRVKLIEMNQLDPLSEPSFAALSDRDQMYLANNWKKLAGVRTHDATMTFQSKIFDRYHTERTAPKTTYTTRYEPAKEWHPLKPWTWKNYNSVGRNVREVHTEPYIDEPVLIETLEKIRENPTELAGTNVHEIGHDYQEFFQDWGKLLTEFDPGKGYYTGHSRNKLAKRFKDAMIEGKNITKEQLKKGDYHDDTWYSSPNELHSELMKARYKIYNNAKAEHPEMSQREIINWIKEGEARGDDNIFDYYITVLNSHFKPETTNAERKALIKILPVLIPAAGLGVMEGMNNEKPQNKYGGNVKTLSKFIKK